MLVTTTYLEQTSPTDLIPARTPARPCRIERVATVSPEFCRFLYTAVGGDWYWTERLPWTLDRWTTWLSRPGSETWVLWSDNVPAGYIELDAQSGQDATQVEIAYFGLLPAFTGHGFGGHLLTTGIGHAWVLPDRWPGLPPVDRVWVHTCSLDSVPALANYQARGLRAYLKTEAVQDLSPQPPGPWPGAH